MTQSKTGASRIGGRLFKSAATSSLALSALAGAMVFAGGEAKAAGNCVVPGDIGTVNFFDETLNYNFMDTCMPVSVANGLIGTINYVPIALGPTGANWPLAQTTLAFDASGTLLLGAGEWKFDKSADRPNPRWDGAALRAEPPVGNLPLQ
jgi:hypothetical protein